MKYRAIIPCAGLGTRMNMPNNKSKELLPDPNTGRPMIEYYLDICKEHNIIPLIITRKEKQDLISYCNTNNLEYMIIDPQGEWPATVLASKDKWADNNFLFLPDTRFEGTNVIKNMKTTLDLGAETCFALHMVDDVSKWGQVNKYGVIEKPQDNSLGHAWGIIGFKKNSGGQVFYPLQARNRFAQLKNSGFVFLEKFVDITRSGVLERY